MVCRTNKSHHVYHCTSDGTLCQQMHMHTHTHCYFVCWCIFCLAVPYLCILRAVYNRVAVSLDAHTHTLMAYAIFHFNFLEKQAACKTCCFSSFTITHDIWRIKLRQRRGKREWLIAIQSTSKRISDIVLMKIIVLCQCVYIVCGKNAFYRGYIGKVECSGRTSVWY